MQSPTIRQTLGEPAYGFYREALERFQMTPEKIEMTDGMLFLDEEDRLTMLVSCWRTSAQMQPSASATRQCGGKP